MSGRIPARAAQHWGFTVKAAVAAGVIALTGLSACGTSDLGLGLGNSRPAQPEPRSLALSFTGDASYAALTGQKGQASILEPIGDDMAVERISWHRVGDKLSCQMQVHKRALANPDQVAIDKSDLCEGASGEQSETKSVGGANPPAQPTMNVITAIRGCFPKQGDGQRLAALEAEIAEIRADGTLAPPQSGKEERFGNGFADCGRLSEWSRCPPGQVGIGVRTHFDRALGAQFIVGLELQCRAVAQGAAGVAAAPGGSGTAGGGTSFGGPGATLPSSQNEARPVLPGDSTSSNSPNL